MPMESEDPLEAVNITTDSKGREIDIDWGKEITFASSPPMSTYVRSIGPTLIALF